MKHPLASLALPALLAAGCLGTPGAQRQAAARKRAYLLEAAPAARLAPQPRFPAVQLAPFRALPPFDGRPMVVLRPGGEAALDHYAAWLAAPEDLVRAQTARYLEQAGLFAAVYDAASATQPPLALEGVLSELALDHAGDAPAAALTLRLLLLDAQSPELRVLRSAEARGRAPLLPGESPALAFGRALTQALEQLARDLAAPAGP